MSGNRRNNKIPWKNHYFQGFCFTVSRHFWIWKVSGYRRKDQIPWIPNVSINRKSDQILWIRNVSRNMETTKFFEYGIIIECVKKHGNDQISWIRKVSRNMETTKSFEYGNNDFCDKHTDRQLLLYINHRPWPAFGRQGLVGSSFEYSYTRLASRLRRSARSNCARIVGICRLMAFKPCDICHATLLPC